MEVNKDDVPIQLLSKRKRKPVVSSHGFKTLLKPAVLNLSKGFLTDGSVVKKPAPTTEVSTGADELIDQVTTNMEEFALKSSKKKTKKKTKLTDTSQKEKTDTTGMDESEDAIVSGKSGSPISGVLSSTGVKSTEKKAGKSWKDFLVLFIGNLPYDVTDTDIREHFIRAGGIKEVRLLTDKKTGKSRGCGYIEFFDEKSYKFGQRLHKSSLKGRVINVEVTVPGKKVFRSKILQKRKEKKQKIGKKKGIQKGGLKHVKHVKGGHKPSKKGATSKPNKYKRR